MNRSRTRGLRAGLVLAGAMALAAPLAALAGAPRTFDGERVHEMPIPLPDGQTIVLHATDSGFIPEESAHLEFIGAGHVFSRASEGVPASYRWSFMLLVKDGARPVRVVMEELTPQGWEPRVDDTAPQVTQGKDPTWTGDATPCVIGRDEPCASWIYGKKTEAFVFRATVSFADGTTEVLHQGSSFDPRTMGPLFKALGVER